MNTPAGLVRVEIDDEQVTAQFEDSDLVIRGADDQVIRLRIDGADETNSISSGEHWLRITRGDFSFRTTSFQIANQGETVLKIELLGDALIVKQDGREIDRRPMPVPSARI